MRGTCYRCCLQMEDNGEPWQCPGCSTWNQSERFKATLRGQGEGEAMEKIASIDENEMDRLLDVPYKIWLCPNGCRGQVEWNANTTDATCMVCGTKRNESVATFCRLADEAIELLADQDIAATRMDLARYGTRMASLARDSVRPQPPWQIIDNCLVDERCWAHLIVWLKRNPEPPTPTEPRS